MSDRRRNLCCVVITVAVLLTFGRVVGHEFVGGWDDGPLIADNPLINPPTAGGLAKIWAGPHARMYIPAVYSVWWGLAAVASVPGETAGTTTLNPWVFHAANLFIHLLATLIVFAILSDIARDDIAACAGALLFALHPLQVEAVAWATGMKDLLCGLLSLAAVGLYLRSADRRGRFAFATACFVAALFAKPAAVVVPLIVVAIDVLLRDRSWRRSLRAMGIWLVLVIPCLVWTTIAQPTPELIAAPPSQRPIIALDTIGFYLGKLFWPMTLGIDYGLTPEVILATRWWMLALVAIATVAIARSRWLLAGLLIFVIGVLPVIGLTPFVFQWLSTVADRYVYLSMLGPAIVTAFAIARFPRRATTAIVAAALLALAARSFVQAGVWRDMESLMQHAAAVNPRSPPANNSLGHICFERGDFPGAYDRFRRAVDVKSDYLTARDNLALALVRLDRADEAIDLMLQTLEFRRKLPAAIRQPTADDLARLSALLRLRGRVADAEKFEAELRALSSRPPVENGKD